MKKVLFILTVVIAVSILIIFKRTAQLHSQPTSTIEHTHVIDAELAPGQIEKKIIDVEPGYNFSNAALISIDQFYDKEIRVGEYHYFKIPLESGNEISLTLTIKRNTIGGSWDGSPVFPKLGPDYGNPSAFICSVGLYDENRRLILDGEKEQIIIKGQQTTPESIELKGPISFSGEGYLAINLDWLFPSMPTGIVTYNIKRFEDNRRNTDQTASYSFKVQIKE